MATTKSANTVQLLVAATLAGLLIYFISGYFTHTVVVPLEASSSASGYLWELRSLKPQDGPTLRAPDGSAAVEIVYEGWGPLMFNRCVSYWLVKNTGERRRFLRAGRAPRSSRGALHVAWSKDSRAVLARGAHSGIDCRGRIRADYSAEFVYTLADETLRAPKR